VKLILARHGNTFSPEMTPVFVGSADDMPLVAEGEAQAARFAQLLAMRKIQPAAVYCGPLKRTRLFASIVHSALKLKDIPVIDDRLNELDYGGWSGKTNEQVESEFGASVLKNWNDHSQWPEGCGWGSTPEDLAEQVKSFVSDLLRRHAVDDAVLCVSSNGRLRYFLKLMPGLFEEKAADKTLKVAPGNGCQIDFDGGKAKLAYWNESPARALKSLNKS
jgi:broad specificity phosphatase PhoE